MQRALEVVRYTVKPGSEQLSLQAWPGAEAALRKRFPGFVRCVRSRGDERQWLDVLEWRSLDDALRAASEASGIPEVAAWMACIEEVQSFEHRVIVHEG
ncbi:antibiotic biosynthesis monooxygenase [Deinococcus peraridilitoris]|uniref:Antibiotic biosynthesis monooxygenase n=1 Tax=Deinococcus peraridilitoris (strain DSM 19664 / LMG 22246 / CIP 109416 / KR-200) TaxID=937777 RepID=K9ZX88_DEIPD|nr:antibiotic biosynthesis monooxygenase [Deinococcus peraridilitoris]AFZ66268.1 Antibiotic biosynthesis monooxygenase [Deinococcus peraridilitoris DSM 19664]